MIKVAITGGIGSGKTFICNIFSILGIPVFNSDEVAKLLLNKNLEIQQKVISLFGKDVYQPNSTINRKKLADIVFNDKIALLKLNNIIHPEVRKSFNQWALIQKAPYVIQESAIIFESGIIGNFDKIIIVTAPEELKIERIIKRDGISKEKIIERMKNQLPEEKKVEQSHFVIVNDDIEMILPQVIKIHNELI